MSSVVGGTVVWNLDVDDKKLSTGLDAAKSRVKSAAKEIDGKFSSLANSIDSSMKKATGASKAFAASLVGIGAAAVGIIGMGVKIAGDLESARQGFVALLGSADKADETMARIKKEAAATPFELPGLVKGTQALAAVTKDGNLAIDTLLDIGKAVATSGKGQKELDSVVLNLQQISATGKVTAMDIRQFQSAIPMFNDIVAVTGLTTEELKNSTNASELLFEAFRKAGEPAMSFTEALSGVGNIAEDVLLNRIPPDMIEALGTAWDVAKDDVDEFNMVLDGMGKGAFIDGLDDIDVGIKEIMQAFNKAGKSGGITAEGFTAQAGTFNQQIGNLKDNVQILTSELVKELGIFDLLKDAIGAINNILGDQEKVINTVKDAFSFLGENIYPIAGAIIGALVPALYAFAASALAAVIPLLPFIAAGLAIGLVIKGIIHVVKNWGAITDWLSSKFEQIKQVGQGVTNFFKKLGTIISGAFNLIFKGDYKGDFGRAIGLSEDSPIIYEILNFRDKFLGFIENIKTGFNNFVSFMASLPGKIITFIKQVAVFLIILPFKILKFYIELPFKIAELLGFALGTITNWGEAVLNYFVTNVPIWIESVSTFFSELPGKVGSWLTETLNKIGEWGTNTLNSIAETGLNIINSIFSFFSSIPGIVGGWLTETFNKFVEWGTSVWNYLSTNVPIWIGNVVSWIKSLPGKTSEGLSGMKKSLKERFVEAWNAILAEVRSWPGRLLSWGKNLANAFVDGVKQGLRNLKDAFVGGFNNARGSVEGKSPPKEGPLKNIDKWGFNVGSAWVEGMQTAVSGFGDQISFDSGLENQLSTTPDVTPASTPSGDKIINITIEANLENNMDIDKLAERLQWIISKQGLI